MSTVIKKKKKSAALTAKSRFLASTGLQIRETRCATAEVGKGKSCLL